MHQCAAKVFRRILITSFLCSSPLAVATVPCPANYSEWLNTATVNVTTVQVCVSNHNIEGSRQLQLTLHSNTQQWQSTVPLDIEGDLRAITLAPAAYALKPGTRAVALELQLRNRGVSFDEERRDLWLFWPAESQLRLVFNQTIELQHWATNCSQECEDTIRSRSELRVLPRPATPHGQTPTPQRAQHTTPPTTPVPTTQTANTPSSLNSSTSTPEPVDNTSSAAPFSGELAPLQLVSHGEVVPGGAEEAKPQPFSQVQHYEFVGERYELVQ